MSYATVAISIVFMINLLTYLYCATADFCSMEDISPAISAFTDLIAGDLEAVWVTAVNNWEGIALIIAIAGSVAFISTLISPSTALLGSQSTVHVLTIISIGLLVSFMAIPDYTGFEIPELVDMLIKAFMGLLIFLAVYGTLRGE